MDSEKVFHSGNYYPRLGLVVTEGARELGEKINHYLVEWAAGGPEERETFLLQNECPRFSSGDGKGMIKESVRGMDLFFIVDVGNYNIKYNIFGNQNCMSPDDHFQDLKRLIEAAGGKAHSMTVIMPMLFGSRQHRRSYRESLDCAWALKELEAMGVKNVVTFDAHDPRVQNAIPLTGFDNIMPNYQVLKTLLHHYPELKLDAEHFMVVSPDEGAMSRNMYYSAVLGVNLGMFYKRRDYSRIVGGRNPIVAHEYLGESVEGKTIFVVDDIISSGESMLDIAYEMKKRKAARFFACATAALFTNGLEAFDKAYADGVINGVLGTNLTYRTEELRKREWFMEVDCSKYCAYIIAAMHHDISISALLDPHEKIKTLLAKYGQ